MQSLEVTWDPPKFLNGEILGYLVTYETTEENESKLPLLDCTKFILDSNFPYF